MAGSFNDYAELYRRHLPESEKDAYEQARSSYLRSYKLVTVFSTIIFLALLLFLITSTNIFSDVFTDFGSELFDFMFLLVWTLPLLMILFVVYIIRATGTVGGFLRYEPVQSRLPHPGVSWSTVLVKVRELFADRGWIHPLELEKVDAKVHLRYLSHELDPKTRKELMSKKSKQSMKLFPINLLVFAAITYLFVTGAETSIFLAVVAIYVGMVAFRTWLSRRENSEFWDLQLADHWASLLEVDHSQPEELVPLATAYVENSISDNTPSNI